MLQHLYATPAAVVYSCQRCQQSAGTATNAAFQLLLLPAAVIVITVA
jgi:hypothetical protein